MRTKNVDLHGNVPDSSSVALLLIDVINDMDFEDGDQLLERALPAARRIARLKANATEARIPAIYVNDNFGKWRSDFKTLIEHVARKSGRGRPIADLLLPKEDDYFVLKPKHSGFYGTTLEILLSYLGTKTLILTGFATDVCVLFTAHDAYMRDFRLIVPEDCIASESDERHASAQTTMRLLLKADTRNSDEIDLHAVREETEADG